MFTSVRALGFVCVVAVGLATSASAATYYASPTGSDAGSCGAQASPCSITKAGNKVTAGDLVYVMQGSYTARIRPITSGNSSSPIRFEKDPAATQDVVFSGTTQNASDHFTCFNLADRDYIHIKGMICDGNAQQPTVTNTVETGVNMAQGASHNLIEDVILRDLTHIGVEMDDGAQYNVVRNADIFRVGQNGNNTGESFRIDESDHNLVENCTVENAGHNLVQIAGSFNLIRNNDLRNEWSRIGSLWGETTEHNVIEGNTIYDSAVEEIQEDDVAWKAWKLAAPRNIIRHNIFRDNARHAIEAVAKSAGPDPSPDISGNRVYNNVFYNNGMQGLHVFNDAEPPDTDVSGLHVINNIFALNDATGTVQIGFELVQEQFDDAYFYKNSIRDTATDQNVVELAESGSFILGTAQTNYSSNFQNNVQWAPSFTDPGNGDFRLQSTSSMIDAGGFVTKATAAGSNSSALTVADGSFFAGRDDYDIDGFLGDLIELKDGPTVRVLAVDGNTLTLDQSISWANNQKVSLSYNGDAPDMGAIEY